MTKTRVLVVEDEQDIAELIKHALERDAVTQVQVVGSGDSALRIASEQIPDLILLDLNLPRKDGREALEEIKQHPELRRIPVVILTTSNAEEDVTKTYNLGASSYIRKPVNMSSLVDIMSTLGHYWFEIVELAPPPEEGG